MEPKWSNPTIGIFWVLFQINIFKKSSLVWVFVCVYQTWKTWTLPNLWYAIYIYCHISYTMRLCTHIPNILWKPKIWTEPHSFTILIFAYIEFFSLNSFSWLNPTTKSRVFLNLTCAHYPPVSTMDRLLYLYMT